MENNNTLSYLEEKINTNITVLKNKSKKNKNRTGFLGIIAVSLSALITLTLGMDIDGYEVFQKNIALVFGAILTIVNGWSFMFNYKKLWVRQKKTLLNLYQLKNKIEYLKSLNTHDQKRIDELFTEYVAIWENDGSEWASIQNDKKVKG